MSKQIFIKRSHINAPLEALFAYHESPGAFLRLTPPWEQVEILENTGGIQDGARVKLKLKIGPVAQTWELIHQNYRKNHGFEDKQIKGPFAYWVHTHRMEADSKRGSYLEDRIAYRLPFGIFGRIFGGAFSRAKLNRMFAYRHEIIQRDLAMHQTYRKQPRYTVAVTGASGLIGSQLVPLLTTGGHTVRRLVRHKPTRNDEIYWNPATGEIDASGLEGVDAVVHLAGENIDAKRWSSSQKQRILESRVQGTRLISETLAAMENKPRVLITPSVVGYYGDRGAERLN